MGFIDETIYMFTCPQCKKEERVKLLDKGSTFGGSHWQHGIDVEHFDVTWIGGGKVEPTVESAYCKKCKVPAIQK